MCGINGIISLVKSLDLNSKISEAKKADWTVENLEYYLSDIAESDNPLETLEFYKDKGFSYINKKKSEGQVTNEDAIMSFFDGITIASENFNQLSRNRIHCDRINGFFRRGNPAHIPDRIGVYAHIPIFIVLGA